MPQESQDSASDNDDSIISDINDDSKPRIPDGGWGWMVVFSSLLLSLIQDGISFSFGMLYTPFEEEFKGSASATSWIGSLFLSVPLVSGPIASALVDKYGCRKMTIVGGLISASGFMISALFVRDLVVMYFTFGVISGMGLGLTYITAVVSIAFWFDKRRNLAVGLGACGTGIGTFVYSPFTNFLLEQFNWRGAVVILAGTLLNICVCGALMRDPEWIIEQNKQNSKSTRSSTLSIASNDNASNNKVDLREIKQLLKDGKDAEYVLKTLAACVNSEDVANKTEHHQSVLNLPTFIRQNEKVPAEVLGKLSENKKLYNIILENYPSLLLCRSTSEKGLNKIAEDSTKIITRIPVTLSLKLQKDNSLDETPVSPPTALEPLLEHKIAKFTPSKQHKPLARQLSSHQRYFKNMRFPRHSLIHRGAVLNTAKYKLRASSCPNIYRVSMATLAVEEDEKWYSGILQGFKDFSMFREFHFFLMALSTAILFAFFMTPFFYLPNHMTDFGYTDLQSSYVMSVIGITNTIGMVTLGWAGDQSWMNVTLTYGICLILCGIFCSAMFFFTTSYIMLMIFAGLFGLTLASSFSFTPNILVELLPLERFTVAYGLMLLCQGIGHLIGPPLCGLLKDFTDSWDLPFHLSGVSIIFAGILILIIPHTENRKMWGTGPVEKEASEISSDEKDSRA